VEERLLAADPAQHAQAGGGVRAESGELSDLVPLLALPLLERLDHKGEQEHEHRHAQQHDQAEHDGRGQQDDCDDHVRDDRPREPRRDVERAARAHRVVRHGGDDLAGRELAADGRPRASRVVRDDLGEPERGLEPVEDREPVPHDPGRSLRRPEPQQPERPERERPVVVLDDPVLDRPPDRERHQRLSEHPEDAEADPGEQRRNLLPADPEQQVRGRPRVGYARVADGQANAAGANPAACSADGCGRGLVHAFVRDGVPPNDRSHAGPWG
jgi:hypothetical protein